MPQGDVDDGADGDWVTAAPSTTKRPRQRGNGKFLRVLGYAVARKPGDREKAGGTGYGECSDPRVMSDIPSCTVATSRAAIMSRRCACLFL